MRSLTNAILASGDPVRVVQLNKEKLLNTITEMVCNNLHMYVFLCLRNPQQGFNIFYSLCFHLKFIRKTLHFGSPLYVCILFLT